MLDDGQLIQSVWRRATGIQAPTGDALHRLQEFTFAIARAALGLPRFALLRDDRAAEIAISEAMTAIGIDVVDDIWIEHLVRAKPTEPELVHRYVFHVGLLMRPDRSGLVELEAPSEEKLEWLWTRGVGGPLPGTPRALGQFINRVLVKARHAFLAEDKRLEDWELLEALDGNIVETESCWAAVDGLDPTPAPTQRVFRTIVAWYLAPRLEGGGLTLGPRLAEV